MPPASTATPTETGNDYTAPASGLTLPPDVLERLGIVGPAAGQSFSIRITIDDIGPEGATVTPVDGSAMEDVGEPLGMGALDEALPPEEEIPETYTEESTNREDDAGLPPSTTIEGRRKPKRMTPEEAMAGI